jgi:hypothetical protein
LRAVVKADKERFPHFRKLTVIARVYLVEREEPLTETLCALAGFCDTGITIDHPPDRSVMSPRAAVLRGAGSAVKQS